MARGKAKGRATKKPSRRSALDAANKARRERLRQWEAEAEAAERKRRAFARTLEGKLTGAMEHAQDLAGEQGYRSRLEVKSPSGKNEYEQGSDTDGDGNRRTPRGEYAWKSPWAIVSTFAWRASDEVGYGDLYSILRRWTRVSLERRVNPDRLARIRVVYIDRGKREEYTLAETLAWTFCLARAMQECDPRDEKSLANRYSSSRIHSIVIWFSTTTQRGAEGITLLTKPRPALAPKRPKR